MPKQPSPSQTLAKFESTCGACSRKKTRKAPTMACPGCRLVHYCDDECRERDRAKHSVECATLAVKGFSLMSSAVAGPGVSLKQWMDETAYHMLPDKLTSKQVEELFARARVAFCHASATGENATYREVLGFWGTCILHLRHETWDQEAYLSAIGELLDGLQTVGPCWCDSELAGIFFGCGNVLCKLGRSSEAVELGRRMKWSVEEALLTYADARVFTLFKGTYGNWLYDLAKDKNEETECQERLELLKEAEAVFNQLLDVVQGRMPSDVVATIQLQLVKVIVARDAFDEALKVAQRGMQFPSDVQASLAQQAIHCLVMLRRFEQAEPLIIDVLVKARRDPKLLTNAELGTVHFHHGVLLSHRGDYGKAHTALSKAEFYISQVDEATQEQYGLVLEEVLMQKLDILDRTGKLEMVKEVEKELAKHAFYRPCSLVRLVREQLGGSRAAVLELLMMYMEDYERKGYWWKTRTRWPEGDVLKPLEVLRDQLEEGSEERAKVEALIERAAEEDEELKQQALEELQREMREGRPEPDGGMAKGVDGKSRGSKAGRKKRRKRERKRQQQQQDPGVSQSEAADEASVSLAGLSVSGEGGAEGAEEEQQEPDECPMCLWPFGEEDEEGVEVLQCRHRFHDVCIDRWLCKCKEKGLLPTCPMCRGELVRGAGRKG